MPAPSRHRDRPVNRRAADEVLGVYDSIDEAEWAVGVLTHHGIGVDGISLVEPAGGTPARQGDRAHIGHLHTIAVLTELVGASARLFGWADHRTDRRRAAAQAARPLLAVLHGTTDDADLAQRILADHAARAGRV